MSFYVSVGPRGILFRIGMIWTGVIGSLTYGWTNRHRPVMPVPRSLLQSSSWSKQSMLRHSGESRTRRDEFVRIRGACVDLGADEEMTELVLASHRHDRTLLDDMMANGDEVRDYVHHKLAIWEAILNEDEIAPRSFATGRPARSPRASWTAAATPGTCERAPANASPVLGDVRPLSPGSSVANNAVLNHATNG